MPGRRSKKLTSSLPEESEQEPYAFLTERLPAGPSVSAMTERVAVSHLLRRLTFGPTAAEVDEAERAGITTTVDEALAPVGRTADLPGPEGGAAPPKGATDGSLTTLTKWIDTKSEAAHCSAQ